MPTITPIERPGTGAVNATKGETPRDRAIAKLMGTPGASNETQKQAVPTPAAVAADPTLGQNPTTEGKEPEAKEALSPQYVALARKEREVLKQQRALKAEKDAWTAEKAKGNPDLVSKSKLKENPLAALEEAGITYDQLVELALNQPNPKDQVVTQLQAKIDALEARLTDRDSKDSERTTQEYEQAINVIRSDVKQLISRDPAFETIKATGQEEEVVELIKKEFARTNVVLTVDEAAREVEELLVEQTAEQIKTYGSLSKIKARLTPPPQEASLKPNTPGAKPQPKTLSNALGVSRSLTPRERAILAFKGELQK